MATIRDACSLRIFGALLLLVVPYTVYSSICCRNDTFYMGLRFHRNIVQVRKRWSSASTLILHSQRPDVTPLDPAPGGAVSLRRRLTQVMAHPSQYPSLWNLRTAVDKNGVLTPFWKDSVNGCSYPGVTCDSQGYVIQINLWGNLGGSLPEGRSISNLTNLMIVGMGSRNIQGTLPADWSILTNLRRLNLSSNRIDSTLPKEYSKLTNLQSLWLRQNKIQGSLPPEYGSLSNLRFMRLEGNSIVGALPESWSGMYSLRDLMLGQCRDGPDDMSNQLTGTLPTSWSSMQQLHRLCIGCNNLWGSLPNTYSSMAKLQEMNLAGNEGLWGQVPQDYWKMKSITWAIFSWTNITGPAPGGWPNHKVYFGK